MGNGTAKREGFFRERIEKRRKLIDALNANKG